MVARPVRSSARTGRARGLALLACLLFLAAALRFENARHASLHLDDFHTLQHARAESLSGLFASLRADNHPPLSFLLVRAARGAFGEGEWALRLPALLAGLGAVALTWRLGRFLPCTAARVAATALIGVSSLHVELSSDLRMYALLALSVAGLADGVLALLEERRGPARAALWIALGLHAHYHFLYAFFLAVLLALALVLLVPRYRARRAALLGALTLGVVPALPWYVLGFPEQLAHGLAPGGSSTSLARSLEGVVHLFFYDVSLAGPRWRLVFLAAGGLFVLLALAGALSGLRSARASGALAPVALFTTLYLGIPLLTAASAALLARAGFEWRYLAGAIAPGALLAGREACTSGRLGLLRRAALAAVVACASLLALFNARDPGDEDYRAAARFVLEHAQPGDAVVAAEWSPAIFPHGLGWSYYAPRLLRAGRALPPQLEHTREFALAVPDELPRYGRVFCLGRSLPPQAALLRALRAEFAAEEVHPFGRSVYVHVFSRS